MPPFPFDPYPDLPLYSGGTPGVYFYDDSSIWHAGSHGMATTISPPAFPTNGITPAFTNSSEGSSALLGPITTNYNEFTNFWLSITNISTNAYVSVMDTLPGFNYEVLINSDLSSGNWGVYYSFMATNSITPFPSVMVGSSNLFFEAELELGGGSLWV
jgi:hypothetical protein